MKRIVRGSVMLDGKALTQKDADVLNERLTPTQVRYLMSKGVLIGDWTGEAEEDETDEGSAPWSPAKPVTPVATETILPESFPGYSHLMNAGYNTYEAVRAASDKSLIAIPYIGRSTLDAIRKAQ